MPGGPAAMGPDQGAATGSGSGTAAGPVPDLLVVGSVALDSITSTAGAVVEALGGSATYFSVAASLLTRVGLVAVVGGDFPPGGVEMLHRRGIDLSGLDTCPGRTFRWVGRYGEDFNQAVTLDTQLNVFATFDPKLPAGWEDIPFLFLANIHPRLQLKVLEAASGTAFTGADTMNFWIEGEREALEEVIGRVRCLTMNEAEIRQFSGEGNFLKAVRKIARLGPDYIVVKRGGYGAMLWHADEIFFLPAWPVEEVVDPTGAGDTFAGGVFGSLAAGGEVTPAAVRRGLVVGSVLASFTVEGFSLSRLLEVTPSQLARRLRAFGAMTTIDPEGDAHARPTPSDRPSA